MTTEQLEFKIAELKIKSAAMLDEMTAKLLKSPDMTKMIAEAPHDYTLAKNIMTAVHQEIARQWEPIFKDRKAMQQVQKIELYIY